MAFLRIVLGPVEIKEMGISDTDKRGRLNMGKCEFTAHYSGKNPEAWDCMWSPIAPPRKLLKTALRNPYPEALKARSKNLNYA